MWVRVVEKEKEREEERRIEVKGVTGTTVF